VISDSRQHPMDVRARDLDDPRLACLIQHLEPSSRGLKVCRKLQVRTIRDFLTRDKRDFTSLRNCGKRTYDDLVTRVHQFLTNTQNANSEHPTIHAPNRTLQGVIANPRALRAFEALGIYTVQHFLETPKDTLLSVRGFGERSYWEVTQRIRELGNRSTHIPTILPKTLLQFRISRLDIRPGLSSVFTQLGFITVQDLITAPTSELENNPKIGLEGLSQVRSALDQLIHTGTSQRITSSRNYANFAELIQQLLSVLDDNQQSLFGLRIGLKHPPMDLKKIASRLRMSDEEAHILEANTRLTLRSRAHAMLDTLREEVLAQISLHRGFVSVEQFTPGSILHSAHNFYRDSKLPLRLLQICFAHEFYLHGDILTTLTTKEYRKLYRTLRAITAKDRLPITMTKIESLVTRLVPTAQPGLIQQILKQRSDLSISHTPGAGYVIRSNTTSPADRISEILNKTGQPTSLPNILTQYRNQNQQGSRARIVDYLRADRRFLEVNSGIWSLRNKHLNELSAARSESDRIANSLLAQPGKQSVLNRHRAIGIPERTSYMVMACLRLDPRVRYLGKGFFCQRSETSSIMQSLRVAIQAAQGSLTISEYLKTQPAHSQRAIATIVRNNRALVSSTTNQVGLLAEYSIQASHLHHLETLIQTELSTSGGYATAKHLIEKLQHTELCGPWLTEHLFLDLARRNMPFELLPGGLLAQSQLGLEGWIQKRVRECLRHTSQTTSPEDLILQAPELTEFLDCIREFMGNEYSTDGLSMRRPTLV
jgi:hypothetical protein